MAGDLDDAIALGTEVVRAARQLGVTHLVGYASFVLAHALVERDPARARRLLQEGIELGAAHQLEDSALVIVPMLVAAHLRDRSLTLELGPRAVKHVHWTGDLPQLAGLLNVIAWAAASEPEAGARLQGAARRIALRDRPQPPAQADAPPGDRAATGGTASLIGDLRREATARIVEHLGDSRLRDLRAEGEMMDIDQAVSFALALIERSRAGP